MVDTTALDLQALTAASLSVEQHLEMFPIVELWRLLEQPRLDAGTGNITLDEAAFRWTLALTGANVAVTENAAMELAASTISGTASFDTPTTQLRQRNLGDHWGSHD